MLFLKCTSDESVSTFMGREDDRVFTVATKLAAANGARDSNGQYIDALESSFNKVYSQFELDALDNQLGSFFSAKSKNYVMLYGVPLNIKLFIFHKTVSAFISQMFGDCLWKSSMNIVMLDQMADLLLNTVAGEVDLPNLKNECQVNAMEEYSLFKRFTIT